MYGAARSHVEHMQLMAAEVSQQLGAEKANAPAAETDIAAAKPEATTILNGVGNGSFVLRDTATHAEVATMLMRLIENMA